MSTGRIALVALLAITACNSPVDSQRVIAPGPEQLPTPVPAPEPTPEPVAPTAAPAPTPVVVPRIDAPDVRFAAVGDIGQGNQTQVRVGNGIAAVHDQTPMDALLLLGDIIYPDGAGHRYERNFAEPWRAVLDRGIRMEAALGNHDVQTRRGADIMELFDMPHRYHAFEIGPAAFFALDSNNFDTEQLRWLREGLGRTAAPWRIVFLHAPAYSSGMHGSTGYVQRGLTPILREFDVQLVLAGHDHHYERTVPIDGTVHIVAGTGCCLRDHGRSDFTAAAMREPGVAVVEADSGSLVLRFVHPDGRVLDSTEITLVQDDAA